MNNGQEMLHSKTKTSFYRRILLTYLIANGCDSVPAIIARTGMPRRTAQDTINALADLDIQVEFVGANRNGHYRIINWGCITPDWVHQHLTQICQVLNYPPIDLSSSEYP